MKILRLLVPLILLATTAFGQVSMTQSPGTYTDTSIPVRSGTYNKYVDAPSLTYNSGTNTLTANISGNAATATSSTSTTNAVNFGVTNDTTTNATMFPVWVTANTGNLPAKVTSTKLFFNPSTGILNASGLAGISTMIGSAANMVITSGTGASRTMAFRTTTSGGTATTVLTLDANQDATFAGDVNADNFNGLTTTVGSLSTSAYSALGGAALDPTTILLFPAGTTAASPMRIPQGVAPSSPVNGDFWSTSAGFFGRAGGVTYGPFSNGTGNVNSTGTPTSGQAAEWTNATTIQGVAVTGTGNYVKSASPTLTGTIGAASLTLSSLTSGRVAIIGASGLLADDADLTFATDTLTASKVIIPQTTSLLLGTAGSAVGNIGFRNATSGTATLAPPTGALGTYTVTLPNAASTLPIYGQQITYAGPTAARTVTYPDASFSVARIDAGQTFAGNEIFSGTITGTAAFPQITLGVNTTTKGGIKMFGNTSGDVTISPLAVAGTATSLTFPAVSGGLIASATAIGTVTGTPTSSNFLRGDGTWATPSGTGTVTVVGAGSLTSTALVTGGGTTTIQTPSATATMDTSGNISTPGTLTVGNAATTAGAIALTQGTTQSTGTTNITIQAPTSVTSYIRTLEGTAGSSGFYFGTVSGTTVTDSKVGSLGTGSVYLNQQPETSVASATTTDLGAVGSESVSITGTTTITSFGTVAAGTHRRGRFTGALTLTYNATSLIVPSSANITTVAGDSFDALSLGSGNWVVYNYQRRDGTALVGGGGSVANPTATIGLTAVNGVASSAIRSDGAPALSQAIAPTWTGVHTFSPTARSSGVASYLTLTTPADTGQTASTESIGFSKTAATRTWATGALTLQREIVFGAPTYAFAGSSTLTTAVNLDVADPVAGTNATITNRYGLRTNNQLVTGILSNSGTEVTTAAAMGALAISVTNENNTKSISVDSTFTFSATPATGQWFGMDLTNSDTNPHTLTWPANVRSMVNQATAATTVIPASGRLRFMWLYDGSIYQMYGDPTLVGSVISSSVATGSAVALTTATAANVTSITLTPGTWEVMGVVYFKPAAATSSVWEATIGTTTATISTTVPQFTSFTYATVTSSALLSQILPTQTVTVTTNTSYFLVAKQTFSAGTSAAFGDIRAIRVQ